MFNIRMDPFLVTGYGKGPRTLSLPCLDYIGEKLLVFSSEKYFLVAPAPAEVIIDKKVVASLTSSDRCRGYANVKIPRNLLSKE